MSMATRINPQEYLAEQIKKMGTVKDDSSEKEIKYIYIPYTNEITPESSNQFWGIIALGIVACVVVGGIIIVYVMKE